MMIIIKIIFLQHENLDWHCIDSWGIVNIGKTVGFSRKIESLECTRQAQASRFTMYTDVPKTVLFLVASVKKNHSKTFLSNSWF